MLLRTAPSCVELWAQLASELHGWECPVELGIFPPPCRVLFSAGMGLGSCSVLEQEEVGRYSWESGSGLNLHMLEVVKGLPVFTEASLFLVLGGVHFMEDMLRSVSQLFIAQKKNVCVLPSLVAYTTFFHIMKYFTVANWPGSWITRQCHRAKCLPVQTAGDRTKAK